VTLSIPTQHHSHHNSSTNLLSKLNHFNQTPSSNISSNNNVQQIPLQQPQSPSLSSSLCPSQSPSPITILNSGISLHHHQPSSHHQNQPFVLSTPPTPSLKFHPTTTSPRTTYHQPLHQQKLSIQTVNNNYYNSNNNQQLFQQPHPNLFLPTSNPFSNKNNNIPLLCSDTRRWSFASVHSNSSSGYTGSGGVNTPPNEIKSINRHRSNVEEEKKSGSAVGGEELGPQQRVAPTSSTNQQHGQPSLPVGSMMSAHPNHIINRLSLRKLHNIGFGDSISKPLSHKSYL
jgi:hypothetical protein